MATKTLKVELPAEIFDVQTNVPLIHQVVVGQLAAARQGTHSTKTRGEVRGGGRKPYRQKGTGRARQGSTRAPQFAGGGVVHGPQPRDYAQRTPKKMKAAALRGALSDRARHDRVHVVESLVTGELPSAKDAKALLAGLSERRNVLVVLDRTDIVSLKSVRNLADVHVLAVDQLNTYDVLCADDVVFTKAAFDTFVGGGQAVVATTPVVVEDEAPAAKATTKAPKATKEPKATKAAPAADVAPEADAAEAVALPKGAVAPLEDGAAPEGYTVKGNADSGLYHEPEGRWYEQTVAEFWFKDAKAAEKAGFTKAGSKKKSEDDK
ncbi:50S ribosomal protein L4 [Oryzobacter terrae]|uniref:50S ribosomal protein L4, sunset domain variant n=1 Tax=Oryzobacter terrae TaxID=1620385 RepID=UPI00366D33B4